MITQEQIEYKANEWANGFDSCNPSIAEIKRLTAELSFRNGAKWVIRQMEADMKEYLSWAVYNGFYFNSDSGVWISDSMEFSGCAYTDDELLTKWREGKCQ